MDTKKYQIFVSSTYKDLVEVRKKVIDTILIAYHFPVGMEMFGADDAEQWEVIKETIEGSDYYVVIIGHRYGSLSPDQELSYTEREYDYARELGIPVLAFIRSRDIATLPEERENNPEFAEKLDRFIQKAQASKMCNFWSAPDELATQVALALPKALKRIPRTGWVRASEIAGPEVLAELAGLSAENRKLKEKIVEYEKLFSRRTPEVGIKFFDGKNIDLTWRPERHVKEPEWIDFNQIPDEFHEYITRQDVDEYNRKLPGNEKLKEMLSNNNIARNKDNSLLITPILFNNGTSPASDVYIEISFPDVVRIMWQDEMNDYRYADMSAFESPVDKAKRKHQMKNSPAGRLMGLGGQLSSLTSIGSALSWHNSEAHIPTLRNMSRILDGNNIGRIEGNILRMQLNKLLHTREIILEEVAVIPVAQGEGDVTTNIMCSEMERPLVFINKINIK